jgi:hypothetical protein
MIQIRMNCQSTFMPRGTLLIAGSIETQVGRLDRHRTEWRLGHKLNHEYQGGCRSQDGYELVHEI